MRESGMQNMFSIIRWYELEKKLNYHYIRMSLFLKKKYKHTHARAQ